MIVRVHTDGAVTLDDADTFTAFHVEAPDLDDAAILAAIGGDARRAEPGAIWLAIGRLHALGAEHGGAEWRAGCDGMLEFARGKGWVDEAGTHVRAHVER